MTRTKLLVSLSLFGLAAGMAAPAAAADVGHGFTITGGATLVTDYRFRGISQTDRRPAVQGTFTVSHSSGFYATVWGSSIDDYVAAGGDQEIDLIAGWHHTWSGTTLDMGVLYYYYPNSRAIIPNYNSDFVEPYISIAHAFGPVTAKATANYAPSQSALSIGTGNEDNLYLAGDLSATIPHTALTLSGHVGHSFGPSFLTIGKGYTDWNVGAAYAVGPLTVGVQYVDTDGTFITPFTGRNASGSGVVGSVGVAF
jgi:uncharacterized protein (TIGR02001 family)